MMKMLMLVLLLLVQSANAETIVDALTSDDVYRGPTVEDQVKLMDTDKNGFADVFEVREYLQSKHGKTYQKALLDKWASNANHKSCGVSFTNEMLTENDLK